MKIVWAVDPFETNASILRAAARAMRALVGDSGSEIQPIYVWCRDLPGFAKPSPGFLEDLKARGQEEIDSAVAKSRPNGLLPLVVQAAPSASLREEARELIERARKLKADLIVVSSHGKKGLKRAFLGSFAETLSLISDIPLFIVRPDSRELPLKQILFPTDFSDESAEAFKSVLTLAKARKSQITLFHKIVMAPYPALEFPLSVAPAYGEFFTREAKAMAEEGKRFVELAAKQGVRAKVVVDRSSPGTVAETIVRRARKAGALIALCSKSGPITGLLLGSTARQILRQADVPIWVIHPDPKRIKAGKAAFDFGTPDVEHDLYEKRA